MCDTQAKAKYFERLATREITGLETAEYNLTPYVNRGPIEKRIEFESQRGLPVDRTKLSPLKAVSIPMDPGTASGIQP